jgi:hypothetical protein
MSALLLAAALAAAPARAQEPASFGRAKTYGVLILAYDVNLQWRQELDGLGAKLKGHPVEIVTSAADSFSVQRAIDRLVARRVAKIVAVPIETVSDSTRLNMTRYMFGVRADPVLDVSTPPKGDLADKQLPAIKPHVRSSLTIPKDQDSGLSLPLGGDVSTVKRLSSPVPLVLASALDQSPLLVAILADRAKALSPMRAKETLVLAGIGPRDDAALKAWRTDAQAIAEAVGAKAGFRKAAAVALRDLVGPTQQDKDRADLQAALRTLSREGQVCVVPLSPEAGHVEDMLKHYLDGFTPYRWNGKGIQGDRRLIDWIKASSEEAAKLPDGRQFKDAALGAPRGGLR